jgi:hypothetical protein
MGFNLIQPGEDIEDIVFIYADTKKKGGVSGMWARDDEELTGSLRRGKPRLVHAIVHIIIYRCIPVVDFFLKGFRVKVDSLFVLGEECVEGTVEHADDFRAFIVY